MEWAPGIQCVPPSLDRHARFGHYLGEHRHLFDGINEAKALSIPIASAAHARHARVGCSAGEAVRISAKTPGCADTAVCSPRQWPRGEVGAEAVGGRQGYGQWPCVSSAHGCGGKCKPGSERSPRDEAAASGDEEHESELA
eukprot:scaffold142082_cov32-Tisochrysis_lutea.AAC.5